MTTSFPRAEEDFAGRFILTHLRAHPTATQVEVVAVGPADTSLGSITVRRVQSPTLFAGDGAPEVWDQARGLPRFALGAEAMSVTAALANLVAKRACHWDQVESHWLVPSALAVAWAAPALPHTAFVHSGDVAWLERQPWGDALARWIVARVNRVVCVSSALSLRLQTLLGGSWPAGVERLVRPMPVDVAVFAAPAHAIAREPLVVAAGRLVPIKGFDGLLFAVAGIAASQRPQVVILGQGQERQRLERLAERLEVRLQLPGWAAPNVVSHWLARAAVCAVPSRILPGGRSEGAPLVAREALAMGTPIVATDTGGLAELRDVAGVSLVGAGDIPDLRRQLCKMLRARPV